LKDARKYIIPKKSMHKIAVLKNAFQEYAWGSKTFIQELLGEFGPADKPIAELWMGAHPKDSSRVLYDGNWKSLLKLVQENPVETLGRSVAEKFSNELPFLLKVLAASRPLSIQAHPNRAQAREGFARENRLKIPLSAPHRNYKDKSHKPEIICALRPFWAMKGFRKIEEILGLMDKIAVPALQEELMALRREPDMEGLRTFHTALLTMNRKRQRKIVNEVVAEGEKYCETDPIFEWMIRLNQEFSGDVGVLSPMLLNLVRLEPGEAMFIPAGEPHAYLEGAGIELMANSDNVLRGGLTPKHIDVPELLKVLSFKENEVGILRPERQGSMESVYPTTAQEFMLSVICVHEGSVFDSHRGRNVEIMICLEGDAHVTDFGNGDILPLSQGTSIFVPSAVKQYRIQGEAKIYKATVPL